VASDRDRRLAAQREATKQTEAIMTDRREVERRLRDLREAMQTESVSRRTFMYVAGAAALAAGLSHNAAVAAPNPGALRRIGGRQASANTFICASEQDISNLDPHTGHDYSITWG
jgi:hypothetical protein